MKKLSKTWLTDGLIDLEYKQYILLAYLKPIRDNLDKSKIYPAYPDMLKHYENLLSFKSSKGNMKSNFPKELKSINLKKPELEYEEVYEDVNELKIIDDIVEYSLKELGSVINEAKEKIEEVKKCIDIYEIGKIIGTNIEEGYFIIETKQDFMVYEFTLGMYGSDGNRTLKTRLIRKYPTDIGINVESIKMDLMTSSILESPSVFLIDCPFDYPLEETLLPITKRLMAKKLTQPRTTP